MDILLIACVPEHDLSGANVGNRWPGTTLYEGPGGEHYLRWHLPFETSSPNLESFKMDPPTGALVSGGLGHPSVGQACVRAQSFICVSRMHACPLLVQMELREQAAHTEPFPLLPPPPHCRRHHCWSAKLVRLGTTASKHVFFNMGMAQGPQVLAISHVIF